MVNVSKSLSVRRGSAITAIRSARKSPAGPMSVSKQRHSLTGTAHTLFDADTDTRRHYWDISLRVNDCPSRIVFESNEAEWSRTEAQEETRWYTGRKRSQKMIGMASSGAMTNGRDLDRNPRTGVPLSLMLKVDAVLRSKILHGHETTRHSQ